MKFMTVQRSMNSSIASFISLLLFTSAIICIRPGGHKHQHQARLQLRQPARQSQPAPLLNLTPTYQYKNFFARGEASFVQAVQYTAGDVFGNQNRNSALVRGVLETGLLF